MAIQAAPYVASTEPSNYSTGVGIGTAVKINFNIDLDYNYIANTVVVVDSLGQPVPGVITYDYRQLVFTPSKPFHSSSSYQVTVLGDGKLDGQTVQGVRSILGVSMAGHYQFGFSTGGAIMAAPALTGPANQSVVRDAVLTLSWSPVVDAVGYEVQVSTSNTMATLHWPSGDPVTVYGTSVSPAVEFPEGIYYWRVRAVDAAGDYGDWSEIATFAKEVLMARPVTVEDTIPDDPALDPLLDPVELVESFPENEFSNVATNLAIVYFTFDGPVDANLSTVSVTSYDVTDEYGETATAVTVNSVQVVEKGAATTIVAHLTAVTAGKGTAQKYGPEVPLANNKRYEATVAVGEQEFTTQFTSRYTPLYALSRDVIADTGGLLKNLKPDTINYTVHLNSVEIDERLRAAGIEDFDQFSRKQYVRYKTGVDLVNSVYLTIAGEGNVNKKLGDLQVSREIFAPKAEEFLNKLRSDLSSWESRLFSGRSKPTSAVRAGNTAYPLKSRVGF